jgi:Alpha amylase, C-terminal all-beta domain
VNEETPAFKIIGILATLRQKNPAISQGAYRTLYTDQDILVFERPHQQAVVFVAVNRGDDTTITIPKRLDLVPGAYLGLLALTSEADQGHVLTVTSEGQATMYLGRLSALVWSQPP